jgi:anti-sigma factor RsiW
LDRASSRALAAYVEGEITPSEAAELEKAVARSPELQRRVEGLRRIKDRLSAPLPDVAGIDLTGSVRAGLEARTRARPSAGWRWPGRWRWRWRWRWPLGLGAFAAAAAALLMWARPLPLPQDDFRARSVTPSARSADPATERWTGVRAFQVSSQGKAQRLGARLPARDGLTFDYANLGPRPFNYLVIFGVDATGEVRWFYPAYERPETNPAAIAIQKGRATLPDAVYHDLPRGPLALHALFTQQPLRVREVEAWVKAARPGAALPWPGAHQQVIKTTVE